MPKIRPINILGIAASSLIRRAAQTTAKIPTQVTDFFARNTVPKKLLEWTLASGSAVAAQQLINYLINRQPVEPPIDTTDLTDDQIKLLNLQNDLTNYEIFVEGLHKTKLTNPAQANITQTQLQNMLDQWDKLQQNNTAPLLTALTDLQQALQQTTTPTPPTTTEEPITQDPLTTTQKYIIGIGSACATVSILTITFILYKFKKLKQRHQLLYQATLPPWLIQNRPMPLQTIYQEI